VNFHLKNGPGVEFIVCQGELMQKGALTLFYPRIAASRLTHSTYVTSCLSPLWNVSLTVRAKASDTAGFMSVPPYFQNVQTRDVSATQLHSVAFINSTSSLSREGDVCSELDEETSVALKSCHLTAVKHCTLTSRNVARSSALTSRQK